MSVRIDNWSLISLDIYKSPEQGRCLLLKGEVYNHPRHMDGKKVVTSEVQQVKGRKVWTNNTEYELGQVDPHYEKWCKEELAMSIDSDQPIKIMSRVKVN